MFRETLVAGIVALSMSCTSVMAQTEAPPPGAPPQGETMMPGPGAEGAPGRQADAGASGGPAYHQGVPRPRHGGRSRGGERHHAVVACVRAKRRVGFADDLPPQGTPVRDPFRTGQMHAFVRKCLGRRSV